MISKLKHTLIAVVIVASATGIGHAAQCDFAKPIASCKGSVTIDSTSGKKGNFAAEVTVKSSAATCSKVEYLIDNTPHQTILKAQSSDGESLFGTSPITKSTIKVVKCTAFEDRETSKASTANNLNNPNFFTGAWEGQVGILFMKAGFTLRMNVNGTSVTGGGYAHNGTGDYQIRNGRVSGNKLTFDYAQPADGNKATVVVTRKSSNSINYSASASGVTLSGTLTKK